MVLCIVDIVKRGQAGFNKRKIKIKLYIEMCFQQGAGLAGPRMIETVMAAVFSERARRPQGFWTASAPGGGEKGLTLIYMHTQPPPHSGHPAP